MLHAFPASPPALESEQRGSARTVQPIVSLIRYGKYGILAGVLVLAAGIPVAWWKGKSQWRAEGVIYVSPRFQRNLDTDPENEIQSNSQYREFVQQQVRTIARYDIIRKLMQAGGPGLDYWKREGETERRAVDRLRASLQILPVPDTYQVTVALEGSKPEGLAELVNATMQSYVETLRSETTADASARLQHLELEKSRLEEQIAGLIEKRAGVARELGTTVFSEGIVNSYDKMLGASGEALMEARRQRLVAEAGVTAREPHGIPGEGTQAEALEKALGDSGITSLKATLNIRKAELLSRSSGLAPQHSSRIAADKEIQQIDRELERLTATLRTLLANNLETIRRSKFQQAENVEQRLGEEMRKLRTQAESYSRAYQRSLALGDEIERLRKRLNATEDRISFLRLEVQAPGWVRVFSPALTPDLPFQGGRKKLLVLVLAAAFVLALAVPVALDYLDPRVRAASELEFHSNLPAMTALPFSETNPVELEPGAIQRAAVTIRRHLPELRHRALVITALSHGGGSTTFVLALAGALNRLGVRTLTIEANPQTPDMRYQASPDRHGLIQILSGQARFEDCRALAEGSLPDRVGTGPGGVSDLLPVERILPYLTQDASAYDVILVDAAPLPVSLATEELIRVLGAAVLVTNAARDRNSDLRASMQKLERLRPDAFGTVLNKISSQPASLLRKRKTHDSTAVLAA